MRAYRVDLHIHTCLSPCGDDSMRPPAIVSRAIAAGLDAIGIADHNSAQNVAAVSAAGERAGLRVLGGMEVTSKEEVHVLAFFETRDGLEDMQRFVFESLEGKNDPAHFGQQLVVDEEGNPLGVTDRLLIGRTGYSIGEIVRAVHERGGLAIASHVDRPAFGLFSQLGFLPADLDLDAAEISMRFTGGANARSELLRRAAAERLPWVTCSDAHYLDDIGSASTLFTVEEAAVGELRLALKGEGGRGIGLE